MTVFVLFVCEVHLEAALQKLRTVTRKSIFPLSAKKIDLGCLIDIENYSAAKDLFKKLDQLDFVQFCDVLPEKMDPNRPRSECKL